MTLSENQKKLYDLLGQVVRILEEKQIWYSMACGTVLGIVREKGFIPWDPDIDIFIQVDDIERFREAITEGAADQNLIIVSKDRDTTSTHDKIAYKGENHSACHLDVYPLIGMPSQEKKRARFVKKLHVLNKLLACKYEDASTVRKKSKRIVFIILQMLEKLIPNSCFRSTVRRIENKYPFSQAEYVCYFANDGHPGEAMEKSIYMETEKYPFYELSVPIPKNYDRYLRNVYGDDYMTPKKY